MKTITYDDSLYCLVPIEPSENMIDAPRGSLNGLELGINNCSQMMRHIDAYGMTTTGLPEWFVKDGGHITKSGKAIIIYKAMLAASPTNVPPPSMQEVK